jgi:hypothetical protein
VTSPRPTGDELAEKLQLLATARDMAEAVGYLIRVADKAGLEAISRGLSRIRVKLIVLSDQRGRTEKYQIRTQARGRRRSKPH